jgi:predicted nucleotidyltransferase
MIENFDSTMLPDLPQSRRLAELVVDLLADPNVIALWLGGSLARGEGDRYSDVDLHVALRPEAYDPGQIPTAAERLAAAAVTRVRLQFDGETTHWHMLLEDGEIYDLSIQPTTQEPAHEARLVLACCDEAFGGKLVGGEDRSVDFPPAVPDDIERALELFWMNQRKHQKVHYRGLLLLSWQGQSSMRQELIRFWYVLETGNDCGPLNRLTIHTLTPVIRAVQTYVGADALALLGQPMRTETEIIEAAAHQCDEIASVGRLLADKLGFTYPASAEETIRRTWRDFLAEHPITLDV